MVKAKEQQTSGNEGNEAQLTPPSQRLETFLGDWDLEGEQFASDFGPAAHVSGSESYEWLPGGKFLVHRLTGKLGDNDMACVEVIGHDAANEIFSIDTFYNNGMKQKWAMRESHPGRWTITGDWPNEGGSLRVRCTINFSEDSSSASSKWESQKDDLWSTFWDLKLTKK